MNDLDEYKNYQDGILDAIQKAERPCRTTMASAKPLPPGSKARWAHLEYSTFEALKEHFRPDGIMNPGGTLGLDLTKEQKIAKDRTP
jgi:alkyldihydroxyacetonephosphate synthase